MQSDSGAQADTSAPDEIADALWRAFDGRPSYDDLVKLEQSGNLRYSDFGNMQALLITFTSLHEEDDQKAQLREVQTALFKYQLNRLFATPSLSDTGRWLREQVESRCQEYLLEQRFSELKAFLLNIQMQGTQKALKESEKVESGSKLLHTWQAVRASLEIIVALLIFNACQTRFESLCMAILIIIYASLSHGFSSSAQIQQSFFIASANGIDRLRIFLKDPLINIVDIRESRDHLAKALRKQEIRNYIFIAKLALLEVICIVQILRKAL